MIPRHIPYTGAINTIAKCKTPTAHHVPITASCSDDHRQERTSGGGSSTRCSRRCACRAWAVCKTENTISQCPTKETPRSTDRYAPHVIQPGSSLPLLGSLHNLHTLNVRTEYFHRHLNAHSGKLVSQQERGIDAAQTNAQAHSGEWVAVLKRHAQDVAGLDTARVPSIVEEGFAFPGGINGGQLGIGNGVHGVFACLANTGRRRIGSDLLAACKVS